MTLILYGPASAGKTSYLKFLGKMMCGEHVEHLTGDQFRDGTPVKVIRRDAIRKPMLMQVNQKGLPVLYDEVQKAQLADAPMRKLLTSPYVRTLDLEYDGYPAVVATSNAVPAMPREFQKRALFFQASASLDQLDSIGNGHRPSQLIDEVGSALFAEYVARATPEFRRYLAEDEIERLDVYAISSSALMAILSEAGCRPGWVGRLGISDYFGEEAMCQRAAKALKRYYTASRDSFERNARENQLIVRCGSIDRAAQGILRDVAAMLPPRFGAEFSPGVLTCNLREIEKLCGLRFAQRGGWMERVSLWFE